MVDRWTSVGRAGDFQHQPAIHQYISVLGAEIPRRHCLGRCLRRSFPLNPDCSLQNSRSSALAAYHLTETSGPSDFFVSCFGRGGPDLIVFRLLSFLDAA